MPIRIAYMVLVLVMIALPSSPLLALTVITYPVREEAMSKNAQYHVVADNSSLPGKYSIHKVEDMYLLEKGFHITVEFSATALWTFSRDWDKEDCSNDAMAVSDDGRVVVMSIRQRLAPNKMRLVLQFRNANGIYATSELIVSDRMIGIIDGKPARWGRFITVTIDGDKAIVKHALTWSYSYHWWNSLLGDRGLLINVDGEKDIHRCMFALADGALLESQNLPDWTTRTASLFGYRCNASLVITLMVMLGCLVGGAVCYGIWRTLSRVHEQRERI